MSRTQHTSPAIQKPEHQHICPACGEPVWQQGLETAPGGVRYQKHYKPGTHTVCDQSDTAIEKPP